MSKFITLLLIFISFAIFRTCSISWLADKEPSGKQKDMNSPDKELADRVAKYALGTYKKPSQTDYSMPDTGGRPSAVYTGRRNATGLAVIFEKKLSRY